MLIHSSSIAILMHCRRGKIVTTISHFKSE
jgi:hypothetical protein